MESPEVPGVTGSTGPGDWWGTREKTQELGTPFKSHLAKGVDELQILGEYQVYTIHLYVIYIIIYLYLYYISIYMYRKNKIFG